MRQCFLSTSAVRATCLVLLILAAVSTVHAASPNKGESLAGDRTPVDINKATVEGLTAIPGVGKVMAQRIVDWREQNGPFRRVEDLLKIKGIGDKSFDKIRPYVKVSKNR